MKKNDRVRILDTDSRYYLHGMTGVVADDNVADVLVNLDAGQSLRDFPPAMTEPLAGWWVLANDLELIPEPEAPKSTEVAPDYVRTTALLAGITAPGFYTIGADEAGRLRVESFTAATVLEADGPEPDEPAGVWVVSRGNEDQTISVLSVHDDELDAWRHTSGRGEADVTFVEFGAPVERIIRETRSL